MSGEPLTVTETRAFLRTLPRKQRQSVIRLAFNRTYGRWGWSLGAAYGAVMGPIAFGPPLLHPAPGPP